MSLTSIPEKVKIRLWGKSAGRCQYPGCNVPLWRDNATKYEFNTAYIAHIIADSPDGPRGDPILSEKLATDLENLMLLCDVHHRLIDKEDVYGHPVELLRKMKQIHEGRIEIVSSIDADKQSHVLLYGANVGEHNSAVSYEKAVQAMLPEWYPAEARALSLGMINSSLQDDSPEFWKIENDHLSRMIGLQLRPRLGLGAIKHLSVFAVAPQPLLISLGYLLSDLHAAEVYQYHREPQPRDWVWQQHPNDFTYRVIEPATISGPPILVISLSATISDERITRVLGPQVSIWRITLDTPDNDFLKSRAQARDFRQIARRTMDRIKYCHGGASIIHVFPAVPVAIAVDFGRIIMPKADLPLRIYDENKRRGGFVPALDLNA